MSAYEYMSFTAVPAFVLCDLCGHSLALSRRNVPGSERQVYFGHCANSDCRIYHQPFELTLPNVSGKAVAP